MPRRAVRPASTALSVLLLLDFVVVAVFSFQTPDWRSVLLLGAVIGCLDLAWVLYFDKDSILLDTILIGALLLCEGVAPAALVRFASFLFAAPAILRRGADPLLYSSGVALVLVAGFIYRLLGGNSGALDSLSDLATAAATAAILGLLTPLSHFAVGGGRRGAVGLQTFVLRVIRQNPVKYFVTGLFAILTAVVILHVSLPAGLATGIILAVVTQYQLSRTRVLYRTYRKALALLMSIVEARDPYTRGHSERVAAYCVALGRQMGIPSWRWDALYEAGLLHDLGKLVIPEKTLLKPGPLSAEEYRQVQRHAAAGAELLSGFGPNDDLAAGVRHHHERYAGGGYPGGLVGSQIPAASRIIAVADAFDAMTSTRSYRSALSVEQAISVIRGEAGRQFDPEVAAAVGVLQEGTHAAQELAWEVTGEAPSLPPDDEALIGEEGLQLQAILEGLIASGTPLSDPKVQELCARIDRLVEERMGAKSAAAGQVEDGLPSGNSG